MNCKRYIIDSLVKHFSNAKYAEYESGFIDNVMVEAKVVGRKYFDLICVRSREDLLNQLKLTKNGMMLKCIRNMLPSFQIQTDMSEIDLILQKVFGRLNAILSEVAEGIEIQYDMEDLFEMIQQSKVKQTDGGELEKSGNYTLLRNLIGLIGKLQSEMPQKQLVIFENIDHMVAFDEYQKLFELSRNLAAKYDVWFLFSSSIDGYIVLDEEFFCGINIINDEIYSFPELDKLKQFINDNYPCYVEIGDAMIFQWMRFIAQKIAKNGLENDARSNVVLKLINESLCINYKEKKALNAVERGFLLS